MTISLQHSHSVVAICLVGGVLRFVPDWQMLHNRMAMPSIIVAGAASCSAFGISMLLLLLTVSLIPHAAAHH